MARFPLLLALVAFATPLAAQVRSAAVSLPDAKAFHAGRRADASQIHVDGRLDDAAWSTATWRSDFRQKDPVENGAPSVATEVAFLYDEDALYVGARLHGGGSPPPASVTRRDQLGNAEHLVIALDTYHDRRTSYSFVISSGGVRSDYYHPSDAEYDRDFTWDPVWQARAVLTDDGWTAEARIPFSQLRFSAAGAQEWGIQINRWRPQENEDIYWVVIPRNANGWASRFGTLEGIEGVRPSRRVELLPYIAANGTFEDATPGDPFRDGSDLTARAGADFKMGLGPNLTLDATVNPDFGQVEADPAEVNLSAFETFFSERRPFFTEGAQLLRGGGPNYFYSRRIGQAPRGPAAGDFVDRPRNATILGAAKVTGRLRSGTSIGVLTAFTAKEEARTYDVAGDQFRRREIEPFTAYAVSRVQQEFGASQSTVGLTLTGMHRSLGDSTLAALLPGTAVSGGGDWNLRFKGGAYELGGHVGFSHVQGDAAAILRVQRHPAHFMQRPDATEFDLDSTRTALTGWSASVNAEKNAGTHWLWALGASAESPFFDINDVGRLQSADDLDTYGQLRYRVTTPGRLFQRWSSNAYLGRSWNFGGVTTATSTSLGNSFTFRNFWGLFLGVFGEFRAQSDDMTRGGPLMGRPGLVGGDVEINSNEGQATRVSAAFNWWDDDADGWGRTLGTDLSIRPTPSIEVTLSPEWNRSVESRQYVGREDNGPAATYGSRYLFARVDRTTWSASLRVNYAFSPDLSLELYGEPFAASGHYFGYGDLTQPRSFAIRRFGTAGTTVTKNPDGSRTVSADGQTFTVGPDDFSVLSFRSNLVLRWEWHPGSTLFLVWQQDRSGQNPDRHATFGSLYDTFRADGSNFVALKMTYWLAAR